MFPLAWLVGKWEGVGEISYHEEVPTQRIYNVITFTHDGGPYLKYESVVKILGAGPAELPGPVLDVQGFDSPEVQALLGRSGGSGPGTAAPPADAGGSAEPNVSADFEAKDAPPGAPYESENEGQALPSAEEIEAAPVLSSETGYWRISPLRDGSMATNEFQLEVFVANADGRLMYFNGFGAPARIELASAKVVRAALADDIAGSKRMYGYVQDQLAWAEDLVAYGHDLGSYLSALLVRTIDGDGNPTAVG